MKQIWSSGGGVQSTAIAALICQGKLPVPDLAIMIDTNYEKTTTFKYLEEVVKPALPMELVVVDKRDYATVDLYRGDKLLVPVFENDGESKLPTFCSNEWKQRVMRRYVNEHLPAKQYQVWIGFTLDEVKRCKQRPGKWIDHYPLIEQRLTRQDCLAIIADMGWPTPPRSSCYMCPNMTSQEWKDLDAENLALAIEFEKQLEEGQTLHRSGKLLSEAPLDDDQYDLFTGRCDSGMCFV